MKKISSPTMHYTRSVQREPKTKPEPAPLTAQHKLHGPQPTKKDEPKK